MLEGCENLLLVLRGVVAVLLEVVVGGLNALDGIFDGLGMGLVGVVVDVAFVGDERVHVGSDQEVHIAGGEVVDGVVGDGSGNVPLGVEWRCLFWPLDVVDAPASVLVFHDECVVDVVPLVGVFHVYGDAVLCDVDGHDVVAVLLRTVVVGLAVPVKRGV